MPRISKKKSLKELMEKKDRLESLKKITTIIYLSHSEEELKSIIEKKLPDLCHVDSITLSSRKQNLTHSKYIYSYSFTYKEENYFVHFNNGTEIFKTEREFLKKIGQALESTVICMEQQKELKINKEQWELAFDTITTPICLTNLQGKILRTNKTFREKTKMSKSELLQKNYFTAFFGKPNNIPKNKEPSTEKIREKLLINGQEEIFEISHQKVSQRTENEAQLVILRDITEQIKLENKITQSAKSAEVGIISGSIAHELNNPIAGIQALLQTLQDQNPDKTLTEDLQEMSLAIQRCSRIINQLLNIHR